MSENTKVHEPYLERVRELEGENWVLKERLRALQQLYWDSILAFTVIVKRAGGKLEVPMKELEEVLGRVGLVHRSDRDVMVFEYVEY